MTTKAVVRRQLNEWLARNESELDRQLREIRAKNQQLRFIRDTERRVKARAKGASV
jgi:hypothetical protein